MLYLVFNEKKQANWQVVYEDTYINQLNLHNVSFIVTCFPDIFDYKITETDFIWIMHYEDLSKYKDYLIKCPAKILYRMSGTSAHPYCYQVDMQEEDFAIKHIIDYNMVFCPRMAEYLKTFYPDKNFVATGYPTTVLKPTIEIPKVRNKEILVGGRLSPDKQILLSMYMLTPLLKEYKITFCYPNNKGKDEQFFNSCYGGFDRYRRLGFNFELCDKQEWINKLVQSEFYFSASLGDVSSISAIEAVSLGVYPLLPKFNENLPVYDVYVSDGYEPFSVKSLLHLVRTKPNITIDDTWYNPDKWILRFKELIGVKNENN